MVWFQCEACGDEIKKPKLATHFRNCSSYKLSCIDCGQVFDRQSVQSHTQCITEAEKYGPKGQAKAANGTPAKTNKDKSKSDVDINVGLSQRPPWFCSLCNTKATSQQALLLHADGKKHRAKARAYSAKQQPNRVVTNKDSNEVLEDKSRENGKENDPLNGTLVHDNCPSENGNVSEKKRKNEESNDTKKCVNGVDDGTATQVQAEDVPKKSKKAKRESEVNVARKEGSEQKIKWKKLITSVLKSTPDRTLKMKKLQKLVSKSLQESGIVVDDTEFKTIIERKVNSSSKFEVDDKCVKLAG